MRVFSSFICCLLTALLVTAEEDGDSLKSAIEAVSRRQLELENAEPNYFSLSSYRYPKDNEEEMPFLAEGRDLNEDGQPENIGYGFQKSIGPALSSENEQDLLTELALEYLEDEMKHEDDDQAIYPPASEAEKRSVFRERESSSVPRKRQPLTTAFRERVHHTEETNDQRRRLLEEAEEERAYERAIENLLENYGGPGRNELDVGKLSTKELGDLLLFLGENGAPLEELEEIQSEVEKRYGGGDNYGTGYDFFNNGAMMGGGFGYKKRSKQQLSDANAAENAFLFSLKFVSPELNREAVEQMREYESIDPAGENDFDVLKLNMKYNNEDEKSRADGWVPVVEEGQERDEFENPNPQTLMHAHDAAKKRIKAYKHHNMPSEYLLPEHAINKKFLYDRAMMKRKRFPVSKRSSNFYTSPPLLHHHATGERKKKDTPEAHSTDPKVASEISHIFASTIEDNSNESIKTVPQIIGNHVVSKQKSGPTSAEKLTPTVMSTTTETAQYNQSVIEDRPNDEEVELPVTMSRLELPIDIKKKSIDWSDYFGLDRRRKKIGSNPRNAVDESWLANQYYKPLAIAEKKHKKAVAVQPFDTRVFDADIFQRNDAKKSHGVDHNNVKIEKMDLKLKNLEDLIVNDALKYTGAHQGMTDSKELQEVKNKVLARLEAAYNLEKMRKALAEFKTSMVAQKMSESDIKKRGILKKRQDDYQAIDESDDNRVVLETNECPILPNIAKKCQAAMGEKHDELLPICALHQICYICGWEGGAQPPVACDGMFAHKAEEVCNGDPSCGEAAVQVILELTGHLPVDLMSSVSSHCWRSFCSN